MSNVLNFGKKKTNHKKGIAKAHKDKKRAEAELRQAAYAKVPFKDKLAKAGNKEKQKLLAKVKQ